MSEPGVSEGYIAARGALLDALAALEQHLDALVLVGAQAIYVHTGTADVAIATHTKDGDVAVDPSALESDPLIEDAMEAAGFALRADRAQPGEWVNDNGVLVDLLVPEAVGGRPGRRGAGIPPHSTMSARKVSGLEAALVDNAPREIASLDPRDHRRFTLRVAGPAALLVAKLHKLGDRKEIPSRLDNKDAHDVYRLLQSTDTEALSQTLAALLHDDRTADATARALEYLAELFTDPTSVGSRMAGDAERVVGNPDQVAAACSALTLDLLEALGR